MHLIRALLVGVLCIGAREITLLNIEVDDLQKQTELLEEKIMRVEVMVARGDIRCIK